MRQASRLTERIGPHRSRPLRRYRFFGGSSFTPTAAALAPDHLRLADRVGAIDLQVERIRQFGAVQRRHAGAAFGNVDDHAVDDGRDSSRIGPGAHAASRAAFACVGRAP